MTHSQALLNWDFSGIVPLATTLVYATGVSPVGTLELVGVSIKIVLSWFIYI